MNIDEKYFDDLAKCENGDAQASFVGERKKIFLIGDSLRVGYCPYVKENLEQEYDVVYPDENCRNTQYVLTSLLGWKQMFKNAESVVAVTFNCGHWDVAHWNKSEDSLTSPEVYGHNIRKIIKQLRIFFPNAKLLFFTTTPMAPIDYSWHTNPRSNEEIERYNEIATRVCKEENVPVKDMYGSMKGWDEKCYRDYVHTTPERSKILGDFVTETIKELLEGEIKC